MNIDPLARIDTTQLYAPFLKKVGTLLRTLAQVDLTFVATSGLRTYPEQRALFEQGRSLPGNIVTNAAPGESAHQFGIAIDLVRDRSTAPGLQPDWDRKAYAPLGLVCATLDLEWGGTWLRFDGPHVQLAGYVTAVQLEPLHRIMVRSGLHAVWAHLDSTVRIEGGGIA